MSQISVFVDKVLDKFSDSITDQVFLFETGDRLCGPAEQDARRAKKDDTRGGGDAGRIGSCSERRELREPRGRTVAKK